MAFDQNTRNRLQRFVSDARSLLAEEFTRQLQGEYGLDPGTGDCSAVEQLTHLDNAGRQTARILRETLAHYRAAEPTAATEDLLGRIVREQAFTVLDRLCALRMAEARGLLLESVAKGHQSRGFLLYAHLAGSALGETGDAYRAYLFSVFDEMAVDLPVLFDRFSREGRLFPREPALLKLLDLVNHPEIEPLWAEDETIGWIYQYFNSAEERREMRAASQAPRNSRELAVRNQFFTPRYVVEFLTDNTLGRLWYEMTKGRTALADSCRFLVRRPDETFLGEGQEAAGAGQVPHRPLKDPRDLKMLDPACGSMHFGLYAFDLFERIYEEAWELEGTAGEGALTRSEGLTPLRQSYASKEQFLRDVPRLIVERNVHGIDIDPRAVQIAGLSLWLRAHRSWHQKGVRPQDRPGVRRSNVVCAEPMPGEESMREGFLATLREDRLERLMRRVTQVAEGSRVRATRGMSERLCELVRVVWERMRLAGEAGSLLKIEEELQEAVRQGQEEWEEKYPLFRVTEFAVGEGSRERYYRFVPGDVEGERIGFWDVAERLVLEALREYAEGAEGEEWGRRRMFAEDAARGLGFVDVCRKRYDVVLMNPPFGDVSKGAKAYVESKQGYLRTKNDLYAAFVERELQVLQPRGLLGAITSRTGFFLRTFRKWREEVLLRGATPILLADLGFGILDAAKVETAAYVVAKGETTEGHFIRLLLSEHKESSLVEAIGTIRADLRLPKVYRVEPASFSLIPSSPFVYWISDRLRQLFAEMPGLETNERTLRVGLQTGDDFRFVRAWWEVAAQRILAGEDGSTQQDYRRLTSHGSGWCPLVKGGTNSPFYADVLLVVNWEGAGKELLEFDGSVVRNPDYYFRAGITWPARPWRQGYFSFVPSGAIFSHMGMMLFAPAPHEKALACILNSDVFAGLLHLLMARGGGIEADQTLVYEAGYVSAVPVPEVGEEVAARLRRLADAMYPLVRCNARANECSHSFVMPPLRGSQDTLASAMKSWEEARRDGERRFSEFKQEMNETTKSLYALSEVDDQVIKESLDTYRAPAESNSTEEAEEGVTAATNDALAADLLSYALGCLLGRWDVRLATGERQPPPLPDPFAPLPACSPGMLTGPDGLPLTQSPPGYPVAVAWGGIIPDDPDHPGDVLHRLRQILRLLWKDRADAIEHEACQILGVKQLRDYLRKPAAFFDDHLKRYSKSRRQAPIYWPLSTPSLSYTLWLYYHRLSDQTLFTCVNDFVEPKLKRVSDDADRLRQNPARSRDEEAELERLAELEAELTDFRAELLRLAPLWKPDLNDGVQITAAPLHRLFQHREWKKKLKKTWEELEAGKYDWAHLALSLWPDRVRDKCKADRSLAIAHGLESLYQQPTQPPRKPRRRKKQEDAADED